MPSIQVPLPELIVSQWPGNQTANAADMTARVTRELLSLGEDSGSIWHILLIANGRG